MNNWLNIMRLYNIENSTDDFGFSDQIIIDAEKRLAIQIPNT